MLCAPQTIRVKTPSRLEVGVFVPSIQKSPPLTSNGNSLRRVHESGIVLYIVRLAGLEVNREGLDGG